MDSNRQAVDPGISRRSFVKSLAAMAAADVIRPSLLHAAEPTLIASSPNPRWYGFNLLEYFSTDPDWMKYFPYKEGDFQENDFRWMRDWGFTWVRLPMDYRFWTSPTDPLKIEESKVEPIDRAIRFGEKYGIHVNICLHRAPGECVLDGMNAAATGIRVTNEKASVYKDAKALDAFTHQWSYFATRYKGISNAQLSFNLVNEPSAIRLDLVKDPMEAIKSGVGKDDYVRVALAAIHGIRQQDPKRLIVSDGYPYAQNVIPELFASGVMQSCHDYTPIQLTHYRNPWARPMSDTVPLPTWPLKDKNGADIADRSTIQEGLRPWATLAARGIPIHFGEMGCDHNTPPAVTYAWFNDSLDVINELHSGWALWNLRGTFGIVDSNRKGTKYQDWHGHQLDVGLLDLLKRKMKSS
jgi:endoglucanase